MMRSTTRRGRGHHPAVEGLEGRELLSPTGGGPSGSMPPARVIDVKNGIPLGDRRIAYTTPEGAHVVITLYGVGSLAGTTVDPDGALNLVFSETNQSTGIVGKVSGGTGRAPVRSLHHANLSIQDLSGIGGSLLNVVNLKDFDLVDGGRINLTGGVHVLFLNSAGRDTQINLRELPAQFLAGSSPGTTSSTANGVTLQFLDDVLGARTLEGIGGAFVPELNFLAATNVSGATNAGTKPGPPPAPPGAVISIRHIRGPARSSARLGDPEVFGYDPTANALIRFDVANGQPTLTIPLSGAGMPLAGVALGRDNGRLVALVGDGTTIRAFDAVTGAPAGQFTTASLAPAGLHTIDGLGSTDVRTVLSDSSAGLVQMIDVTASLASGQAVPVGRPLAPRRQFELAGGLTGVTASNTIYAAGAAHFDTSQPDLTQAGLLAVDTTGGRLRESSRTALMGSDGSFINAGPSGTTPSHPVAALGSVDQDLALVTGVVNGTNVVTLFSPQNPSSNPPGAITGTVALADPNRLAGLSESFRPALQGTALIDVQGNVQSLRAVDAQGLVFNTAGYLNLAKIEDATDTTIVGLPFGHAEIPHRSDVKIFSSARTVADRNGVTIIKDIQQVGPLSLP
ncbi:MAG: hypothetical protein ACM35G_10725 [Planctomycetaceae bacterium]